MNDNAKIKKEDLSAALTFVECIKNRIAAAGKDSNGNMIYEIRGSGLLAPPGRLLEDVQTVLDDVLHYLYTPDDPIVERLKAVKELRGSLDGLKSATADGVEFYEVGDKNGD